MKFNPGKWLFPKLPPDLRRRKMATIYLTVVAVVVIGAVVALILKLMSTVHTR